MNIMFILKSFEVGGLEVVSAVLANKFVKEGHNVSIYSFSKAEHSIESRLDKRICTYTLKGMKYNEENIYAMRAAMLEERTQIVINQWGLPLVPIKVVKKASQGLNINIISVYHNNPSFNGRIQNVQIAILKTNNLIKRIILNIKKKVYSEITSYGMRYNYKRSDRYIVLSQSFIKEFIRFSHIKNPQHLTVQTNPVTIDCSDYKYFRQNKKKEVLYVGRLDYIQKRVSRLIKTWSKIEKEFSNWHLSIVGVGDEEEALKDQVKRMGLQNISFEGYQDPISYYERASVLILTSEYEGFPLVLAESMSFGVVPVVYASYPAVYDIIKNKKNGLIVEPRNGKFVVDEMAFTLATILKEDNKRNKMAQEAIKTSQKYSIDVIYHQWMRVFNELIQ